jgi:hypothetical protein
MPPKVRPAAAGRVAIREPGTPIQRNRERWPSRVLSLTPQLRGMRMTQHNNVPTAPHADRTNHASQRTYALRKHPLVSARRWLVSGGTVLIVALALGSSGCAASTSSSPQAGASKAAAQVQKPEKKAVPHLVGLTRAEANAALRRAGLTVGAITRQPSSGKVGTVLRQGTAAGKSTGAGSSVTIVLAAPLPKVPGVVGSGKATAMGRVKAAGFSVRVSTKTTTSGEDNVVISQSPSGGSGAKPGTVVELVISDLHKPPTLSAAGGSSCTPGYTPCLPPASDYDCEGGSGDGPKYMGLVHVTGSDPYGLDVDGDGVGCDQ